MRVLQNIFFCIITLYLFNIKLYAEIITDGTVGQTTSLSGPNFLISDKLGQLEGSNLFHSFKEFNIHTSESVLFTGPESVTNIITRVTGGDHSFIDGVLRSNIPNANFYLLNPNGLVFGENARLDVTGSFHASTADYIRLGENGIFSATHPSNSILTVMPPSAFGFLDNNPAPISIQGSFINTDGNNNNALSFISGDLKIQDGILLASGGRINLAAVASAGEVIPTTDYLKVDGFKTLGKITLSQSSSEMLKKRSLEILGIELANIDVSDFMTLDGTGAGQVFIRADQLSLDKAWIFADTYGDNNGLGVDISIDGDIQLINGARITADNLGKAQGGSINITAKNSMTFAGQNTEVEDFIDRLSAIATNTYEAGIGGIISINTSLLNIKSGLIQSATNNSGNAGNIVINAQQIALQDAGLISTGTENIGQAGNITMTSDNISVLNKSSISSSTALESSGNAGHIQLNAQNLTIKDGGQINAFSLGKGDAGSINITTDNASLINDGVLASITTQGSGNDIHLLARHHLHIDNSFILTRTTSQQKDAGNITFKSNDILLAGSDLLANTVAGEGGKIDIRVGQLGIFGDSVIDVSSKYGINGSLILNTIKLTDDFLVLPPLTLQGPKLVNPYCEAFAIGEFSEFVVKRMNPLRIHPEDLQTYHDVSLNHLYQTTIRSN